MGLFIGRLTITDLSIQMKFCNFEYSTLSCLEFEMVFVCFFVCLRQCLLQPELTLICYAAKDGFEFLRLQIFLCQSAKTLGFHRQNVCVLGIETKV